MSDLAVATGKVVTIHYTLTNADALELDSSRGGPPLAYLHGADNIVPGLERQLEGKVVGDTLQAIVPPAEGYGESDGIEPRQVPRDAFPEEIQLEPGAQFMVETDTGHQPIWVVDVVDDIISISFEHPLAGETLNFAVEIVAIRDASEEEVAHGHPHGPGGHHHH